MLSINSHLFLRRPEPSDAAVFYQYKNDPSVISSLGGFHHGLTLSNINHWIDKQSSHDSQIIWSIVFSSSNHCIGHVGFYNIDYRIRCAEFGILIGDKEFQGKGIGFQVTHYLLNYGFYNLNLNRISLLCFLLILQLFNSTKNADSSKKVYLDRLSLKTTTI